MIGFRVSAFFQAFLFLLLGSRCPNTPLLLGSSFIKVSVWVYSFFLSLGFRFGLTPLFRVSAWVSSFLGFRFSFKLAFDSFRVLGWVYSFFIMGFLSLGFRSGFTPFRASAWV